MGKQITFLLVFMVMASCSANQKKLISDNKFYGEEFVTTQSISYEALLEKVENSDQVNDVVVKGDVSGVCQAMGCWMTMISQGNDNAPEMFVKFKDYGFFVPKDLGGGKVIMKGNAFREETSVEELRHYAEDDGKSKEEIAAITKPIVELKFMASGVQVIK